MNDYVADMRQRLEQLNRLENQLGVSQGGGNRSLDEEALIESLRANISVSVLLHHDRLRSRGRRSIAEARHGVCSGCHMGLPIGTVAALKHQAELVKCNNCGRYVFSTDDELALTPPPGPRKKTTAVLRKLDKLTEVP